MSIMHLCIDFESKAWKRRVLNHKVITELSAQRTDKILLEARKKRIVPGREQPNLGDEVYFYSEDG